MESPQTGSSRFAGKTVVLVGAGSFAAGWSNGNACAISYARAGAAVVCVDRVLARAEETANLIAREGGRALAIAADATQEEDLGTVVSKTLGEFGRIDVMHNNVGVGGARGAPDEIEPDAWDREIAQNLKTAYLGIRCAVPSMKAAGGGVIINISSLLAVRFLKHPNVAYAAAKAGVEALTRSCAVAYGADSIRVNCIRIGFSETPIVMSALNAGGLSEAEKQAALDTTRRKIPLRREHGEPFDVANAALFLASDDAKHITGVILNVDGGLECAPL